VAPLRTLTVAGRELAMHGIQVSFGLQSGGISSGAGELTSHGEALPLGILVCCLTKLLAALAAYVSTAASGGNTNTDNRENYRAQPLRGNVSRQTTRVRSYALRHARCPGFLFFFQDNQL
jgi:hypothetical protein